MIYSLDEAIDTDAEAAESLQETKRLPVRPRWKRFSDYDPFLSLIGMVEDEATDVSRDKFSYLADLYGDRF